MPLRYTKHGDQRANQRGFRKIDVELIRCCGTLVGDREAEVYLVRNRDVDREIHARKKILRQIENDRKRNKIEIQQLEKIRHVTAVIVNEGLVTVHHTSRPHEKRLLRRIG